MERKFCEESGGCAWGSPEERIKPPSGCAWGSPEERKEWDKYYEQCRLLDLRQQRQALKAQRKAQREKEGENVSYSWQKVTANVIFRRGGRRGAQEKFRRMLQAYSTVPCQEIPEA